MPLVLVLSCLGLSGCGATSDAAFCGEDYTTVIAELRGGLEAHPETPDAVGEPATDAVLGHEAGCATWLDQFSLR